MAPEPITSRSLFRGLCVCVMCIIRLVADVACPSDVGSGLPVVGSGIKVPPESGAGAVRSRRPGKFHERLVRKVTPVKERNPAHRLMK